MQRNRTIISRGERTETRSGREHTEKFISIEDQAHDLTCMQRADKNRKRKTEKQDETEDETEK